MSTKISVFVFFPAPFHLRSVPPSITKARRRCEKGNGGEEGPLWGWLGVRNVHMVVVGLFAAASISYLLLFQF